MSLAIFYSLFIVVTLNLLINLPTHNYVNWVALIGMSLFPFFVIIVTSDFRIESSMHRVVRYSHQCPLFYVTVAITVAACTLLDYILHLRSYFIKPSLSKYLRTVIASKQSLSEPSVRQEWEQMLAKQKEKIARWDLANRERVEKKRKLREELIVKQN